MGFIDLEPLNSIVDIQVIKKEEFIWVTKKELQIEDYLREVILNIESWDELDFYYEDYCKKFKEKNDFHFTYLLLHMGYELGEILKEVLENDQQCCAKEILRNPDKDRVICYTMKSSELNVKVNPFSAESSHL
jgi:hypothetical protein